MYSSYQDASEIHERLKQSGIAAANNQKMQREMQQWLGSGMKGPAPYTQGQLQDATRGVVGAASQLAESATKMPGTSFGGALVTPPGPLVKREDN